MIHIRFILGGVTLFERNWPAVPRHGEFMTYDNQFYAIQNITWNDIEGLPIVHVFIIQADAYESWLTGRKD